MKIKGAIFDLDGTLTDTESFHFRGWVGALGPLGVTLSEETYSKTYSGKPAHVTASELVRDYCLPVSGEELMKQKRVITSALIGSQPIVLMEGANQILDFLSERGIKRAIASGDTKDANLLKLEKTGLTGNFDVAVSGDDVKRGKPTPDIYMLTVRKLCLKPSECVAFEDTAAGVEAAKSAGLFTVAVPNQTTKWQDFSRADKKFGNLAEALGWLKDCCSAYSTEGEQLKGMEPIVLGRSVGERGMNSGQSDHKINVAIIGCGNCAKSFVEGLQYYSNNLGDEVGLMHHLIGVYHPSDIQIVAAVDIDERKVDFSLDRALCAEPNRTMKIADIPPSSVIVQRGLTLDSIIPQTREFIHESSLPPVDIVRVLRESGAEIVINAIPTGSVKATYAYAEAALAARCSFINCIPTPIAKDEEMRRRFEERGLVLLGDDIKSQLGASVLNKAILELFKRRGILVTESDQTNYGGNADHQNLHHRPEAKEGCKIAAAESALTPQDARPDARMIYTPTNYDTKKAVIKINGRIYGHIPVEVLVNLTDQDSPNVGALYCDAIRIAKLLMDTGRACQAVDACSPLFKYPPIQRPEAEAQRVFDALIDSCVTEKKHSTNRIVRIALPIAASIIIAATTLFQLQARENERMALAQSIEMSIAMNGSSYLRPDLVVQYVAGAQRPIGELKLGELRQIVSFIARDETTAYTYPGTMRYNPQSTGEYMKMCRFRAEQSGNTNKPTSRQSVRT